MTKQIFEGKKILVTGGAGSIGSNIVRELLKYDPNSIRILDNNEAAIFSLENELKKFENVRYLIGDIRFRNRLKRAMENIDIVFHAAALKHVPLCEFNPFEAVETNVVGTQNTIDMAIDEEVEKFIGISTDKAVNPINTMGATKLLSEKLITTANYYKGERKTNFSCVRFGNVLGSSGSVIVLFKTQIKNGGPVTLTHPEMTRFFMSMEEAIQLIFKATEMAKGGEVFIFKMPAMMLKDLAEVMIEELAKIPEKIKIKTIGIRHGEKLHEELIGKEDDNQILETNDMFIVLPKIILPYEVFEIPPVMTEYKDLKPVKSGEYSSKANVIGKEDVRKFLKKEGIL